jgi:hypothetical protein
MPEISHAGSLDWQDHADCEYSRFAWLREIESDVLGSEPNIIASSLLTGCWHSAYAGEPPRATLVSARSCWRYPPSNVK